MASQKHPQWGYKWPRGRFDILPHLVIGSTACWKFLSSYFYRWFSPGTNALEKFRDVQILWWHRRIITEPSLEPPLIYERVPSSTYKMISTWASFPEEFLHWFLQFRKAQSSVELKDHSMFNKKIIFQGSRFSTLRLLFFKGRTTTKSQSIATSRTWEK